jgi:hypothetical protein
MFFNDYMILGDDIVIFNCKVAENYQLILKELGIPINLSKSIIGSKGKSQIEFLKRLSLKGKEFSSIKNNILNKNSMLNMLDLIDILIERDLISPNTGLQGLSSILSSKDLEIFKLFI